jgi:serine/threonine protein kinase
VVKVIHRALAQHDEVGRRFALEAHLAAHFDHRYAAHVYAFGLEPDGVMWIAMELVKGTPLGELIDRSGPLGLDRFVPLFERLCEVVQSAHDQGIVHRDLEPSNVMVTAHAGRLLPKLLDFGIAKMMLAAGEPDLAPREHDDPAADALISHVLLADGDDRVRAQAVFAASFRSIDRTVAAMGGALQRDSAARVRMAIVQVLGQHRRDNQACDPLLAWAQHNDRDANVRDAATRALRS